MNEEVYVSFETAKLLKEKGFDWKTIECYSPHGGNYRFSHGIAEVCGIEQYPRPTQQMACRWLREEKGFYVYAVYGDYPTENKEYWVPELGSLKDFMVNPDFYQEYDSPEDAIEAALQYCLTKLIEQ